MNRLPKITLLSGMLAIGVGMGMGTAYAQDKKKAPAKTTTKTTTTTTTTTKKTTAPAKATGKSTKLADGFVRLESGLEYKIFRHGTGTRKPVVNDHIELNILFHCGDSVIFNSRKMNNNKPVPLPISAPKFKGDPMEGFMLLVTGDSAVLRLPVDSMKKQGGLQPWMKEGKKIEYDLVLVSVRSEEEEKKFNEEQTSKQKGLDEKLLQEYFAKNNIKPSVTASGLYYTISAPGTGETIKSGYKTSVNYTGKLLNGSTFDSNIDSNFHHVQPFQVEVGKGRVIKGWDEGLMLLRKGTKAVLYIPSYLAYGSQDRSPQIPANSILVFEVEITDVQAPVDQAAADDKLLQDYFGKNHITATKTPSGLYYSVSKKGTGPNAEKGKKVTMNYTGKTLDGKSFDSNVDSNFHHVAPFPFTLGMGQVIKGWDEGIQLFNLGTKATLYIPSGLAYGERGAGGAIPANTVLVFDVEVTDIEK